MYQAKQIVVRNGKIEYRGRTGEDTFKTVSPRSFIHGMKDVLDLTTEDTRILANEILVKSFISGDFSKGVELNMLVKQSSSRAEAYAEYAKRNGIKQF